MRRRLVVALCGLALSVALIPAAEAAGLLVTGRGVRAFARGGAPVVSADDLNAQWINPALLAAQGAPLLAWIEAGVLSRSLDYQRGPDARVAANDPRFAEGFPTVSNNASVQALAALGVASNLGLDRWVFAFGIYSPMSTQADWPGEGPQRYALISTKAVGLTWQLSAAWRPLPNLMIGVGGQLQDFLLRQELAVSTYPGVFGWQEDPNLDARVRIDVSQRAIPAANVGVWWAPAGGLEVAASFQTGIDVDASGRLYFRRPRHYYFSELTVVGDAIGFRVSLPWSLRAGLRYRWPAGHDVELSYIWTGWSVQEDAEVRPKVPGSIQFTELPGIGSYTLRPFVVKQDFRDSHSVHLGGSMRFLGDRLEVMAGGYFETSAVPDSTLTVAVVDAPKVLAGLGAAWRQGPWRFNLGYAHIVYFPRDITASAKTQVNPLFEEDEGPFGDGGPATIGNGRYTSAADVVGVSVDFRWDPTPDPPP